MRTLCTALATILRTIGLWARALVALAVVVFLGLLAWNLLANFWALGIGGMAIVALVLVTLYVLGSQDDKPSDSNRTA